METNINPPTEIKPKKWYESKALWFNVITAGIGLTDLLAPANIISPHTLFVANAVGNTILRVFFSSQPIQMKKSQATPDNPQ